MRFKFRNNGSTEPLELQLELETELQIGTPIATNLNIDSKIIKSLITLNFI